MSHSFQLTQPLFGALEKKQMRGKIDNSSNLDAYYHLMVNVAKAFGAINETAHNDMKEVLLFEKKLSQVT